VRGSFLPHQQGEKNCILSQSTNGSGAKKAFPHGRMNYI